MKKFIRYLALLLTLFTLLTLPSIPAQATAGGDVDIGHDTGKVEVGDKFEVVEGASDRRTGFMIWASDGNGTVLSKVAFVPTYGNSMTWRDTSIFIKNLVTITGNICNSEVYGTPVPWNTGPFDDDIKANMDNFVTAKYGDYENGGEWILEHYLGMSKSGVEAFMEVDEPHLNIEPVMLAGIYEGTEYSGIVLLGSVRSWASVTESNNWLGLYSHGNLANMLHLVEPWLGIRPVTNASGRHPSSEILATPYLGYGFASYRLTPGDKTVIKVYIDKNGNLEDTVYTTCGKEYEIKDEGSYKLSRWAVGETKTTLTGKQTSQFRRLNLKTRMRINSPLLY